MAPTIHCIRHGQGFHNVGGGNYNLPDPKLTPEGEAQCLALRPLFQDEKISMIFSSPMTRALQSTYIAFEPALKSGSGVEKIIAVPDAQETSDDPCDIGSDPALLRQTIQDNEWPVDLGLVKEGWNVKKLGGRYSPSSRAIAARARDVRSFLRQQVRCLASDAEIVLVAHGGFMHYFSGDWEDADKRPGTGWVNCEVRSYTFEDVDGGDSDALLIETDESRNRRGYDHPMPGREAQRGLVEKAMMAWENQGLQNPSKLSIVEERLGDEPENELKDHTVNNMIEVKA